jgi:hypothetical protein
MRGAMCLSNGPLKASTAKSLGRCVQFLMANLLVKQGSSGQARGVRPISMCRARLCKSLNSRVRSLGPLRQERGKQENDRVIALIPTNPVSGAFGKWESSARPLFPVAGPLRQNSFDDSGAHLIFFDLPVHTICTHRPLKV